MRQNGLVAALQAPSPASSAWLSTGSPYLAEALAHAGFDAVTVDLQHGMFGIDTAISLLQAISTGPAVPMARLAGHDAATIGKLLDAGAYGLICPNVDTPEECADFVRACRYPPDGTRSYGPSRGLLYGGADYVRHADSEIIRWAMVESASALDHLDAIVSTPGLDAVYLGPSDLSMSLGLPVPVGPWPDQLVAHLDRVVRRAQLHDRSVGIFCSTEQQVRQARALGVNLITPGNDLTLLRAEVARRLDWVSGSG